MKPLQKILIIEDEITIQSVLKELLTNAGYSVSVADDGVAGIQAFLNESYDLVLLDVMMPKLDGYAVCKRMRETSDTPIIMLTALDDEQAQIKAFEMKADDYITKPFSLKLVLMHVEAVLRRTYQSVADENEVITYKNIRLDPVGVQVFVSGHEIALTRIEYELLHLFLKNQGRVFTRDNLVNIVWGYDFFGDEKTVNIHIMNLRRKLGVDCIDTIRGVGYRLAKEN